MTTIDTPQKFTATKAEDRLIIGIAEREALAFAQSAKNLRKRFRKYASFFGMDVEGWRFNHAARSLTSPDGSTRLQWMTRKRPSEPESYENQQTTVGFVDCGQINRNKLTEKP